jgi:hypothetical protein
MRGRFEQRQMLDDSGDGAALQQVASILGGQEVIDPIMAMLHHAVTEHLGDLLEGGFSLLGVLQ